MMVAAQPPCACSSPPPRPVVLDTDPGIDDALALMLALRSPECRVELITTVAGNVPVTTGTANVRRLLALISPAQWPVVAEGAARPRRRPLQTATAVHDEDGLGGVSRLRGADGSPLYPVPEHPVVLRQAARHLVQCVERYGRDLTVIALGPLTNIAQAIQLAPATMQRLGRLVIMGGAIGVPGNISPTAEFNMFVDPQAADIVLRCGVPITLVPLDVTRQVRLTPAVLQSALQAAPTRLAQATLQMTWQTLQSQEQGMALHDPLAVAIVLDPSLVRLVTLPVCVETRGTQTLGMTVADRRPAACWAPDMPRLEVAVEVDAARMLALFTRRVLRADDIPTRRTDVLHA